MAKKVFIDSFLADAKMAYECSCDSGKNKSQKRQDTKKAIAEVAAKQVVRKTITDGYIDEARRINGKTAQRIDPDKKIRKELPVCPPGYVYSRERKDCIPRTERDKVNGRLNTSSTINDGANYNVWGRTGLNGDGYAYEDKPKTDMNSSDWSGYQGTQVVGESKKECKDGYRYDEGKKKCVPEPRTGRSGRTSLIYTLPYLSSGHHGVEDNDQNDQDSGTDNGSDGGGMAEGRWLGGSFVKEVCTRCSRPLVKGKLCKCLIGAKSAMYPSLSDLIQYG
jgi:RNase P subunit RPR2